MSGPKVVRIVTREELIAMCEGLLAQLDTAIESWAIKARAFADVESGPLAAARERRSELAQLMRHDRFAEFQLKVSREIPFVWQCQDELIKRAAQSKALAQERISRQRQNAATLLGELQRRGQSEHEELIKALTAIIASRDLEGTAEAVLAMGFRALEGIEARPQVTDAQRALAQGLMPERDLQAERSWRLLQETAGDERLASLRVRLGEIEVRRGKNAVAGFVDRLRVLELESEAPEKAMRIDALVLEVAATVRKFKHQDDLVAQARSLLAEIDATPNSSSLSEFRTQLAAVLQAQEFERLPSSLQSGKDALDRLRLQRAAEARRQAILTGLSELGYEVHEGMATAWAAQGRVVLRKPTLDGYGIEVAGAPDSQRLQVRAVAFSSDRDLARDRDVETLWCGDLTKLKALFGARATTLELERALPVGATPLKVVDVADSSMRHGEARRSHGAR